MLNRLLALCVVACLSARVMAQEQFIWIEGEKADKQNVRANAGLNTVNPDELSGGAWISNWSHEKDPDGTAQYKVEIPQNGAYHLWVRAVMGTGLSYRLDHAAEPTVVDAKTGINSVPVAADGAPFYPPQAFWFDLGAMNLTAGQHEITWYLGGTTAKDRWGGIDCFLFTTGAFKPNGKYKPTDNAPAPMPAYASGAAWDFKPAPDTFDPAAMLDLRYLNEKTAGEHGFIKLNADGSGFVRGDGQPIKFWAVLAGPHREMDLETQKKATAFLAKRGVNIARLFSGGYVAREGAQITDVDDKLIDEQFKVIAALKSAGIYVMTSPYWATDVNVPKSWGIPGLVGQHKLDSVLFFDPTLQRGYKAWMKEMYTRKNPYTGLSIADDPAIAIIQIQNEDSLLWGGFNGLGGEQLTEARHQFAAFIKKKYGSYENARQAWQNYKADFMADDWEHDLPGFQHVWDLGAEGRAKKGRIPGFEARSAAQNEFLATTMYQFNQDMAKYFREELGCKQLINAGNWRAFDPLLGQDAEYWSYTANDIIARNIYTGGYHAGVNNGWTIMTNHYYTDVSMTRQPVKLPTNVKQPVGRPFIIPETLWTPPDLYQSEGPLMLAGQMSLGGVSAAFWSVRDLGFWNQNTADKWAWNTPMLLGQFPAAALIYRQGLVREGTPAVMEHRTMQDLWERKTPIISEDTGWDPNRDSANITPASSVKTAVDPLAYLVGPVRVVYGSDPAKTEVIDLGKYIDRQGKIVRSDTGQIETDYGKGVYRVNAPEVQAAAGFLQEAGVQQLADVEIDCHNKYATIVVVALDGKPIKESGKVLVQVGTTCRPTGWSAVATRVKAEGLQTDAFRIITPGKAPWQVENTDAAVSVSNAGLTKAVLLDVNGMATDTTVQMTRANDKVTVMLPANAMYLVLSR